jgi:SAM-dependent methyltransferase
MNYDTPDDDGSILYYDGDYPSLELNPTPSPDDVEALRRNGLLGDVAFYLEAARQTGGAVLELGCGDGRLAIPLARAGHAVTGVDVSAPMLTRCRVRLAAERPSVAERVRLIEADATRVDLGDARFDLVMIPFNVLILMAERRRQRALLDVAAKHLAPGGAVVLDILNPLVLSLSGDTQPQPSHPRRNPVTGNPYVKHAVTSMIDAGQRQRIYGWYEELFSSGAALTCDFAYTWRLIFRGELTALLELSGLAERAVFGDFDGAPWAVDSSRMVAVAGHAAEG